MNGGRDAASSSVAIAGALAINGISNTIDAHISDSTVNAGGDVTVAALDNSSIQSRAGGAAISAGSAGVGLAISANYIANDVTATIDTSTIDTTGGNGSVTVTADEAGSIDANAVGLSAATNTALAGSATVSVIVDNVKAGIEGEADVAAGGNVRVKASNGAHVGAVAGQIAAGGSLAFGASTTDTTIVNTTEAVIDGRATVSADVNSDTPDFTDITGASRRGVSVEAESPKDVTVSVKGGSVSNSAAVAGSFSVTVIDDTTHAHVSSPGAHPPATAGITSNGSVNVVATSGLALSGAAGSLAIGTAAVGVGVGADVGVATIRTLADIDSGVTVSADDSVIVQAIAGERALSLSVTGAASGRVAVGVTAGVSTLNLTTDAHIGTNANVSAEGNVVVQAQDTTKIDSSAGNTVAAGNVSVGVAGGVSVINKTTESYIGSGAHVTAKGNRDPFLANTGTFTESEPVNDDQKTSKTVTFTTQDANIKNDTIHAVGHGFSDGQEVVYAADKQPIKGLTNGTHYFVKRIDADNFKLTAKKGGAPIDLKSAGAKSTPPTATHSLTTVVDVGLPTIDNYVDLDNIRNRPVTHIQTADRTGVVVSAVSVNDIATTGSADGASGVIAVQVAGAVNVHTIDTLAHIDAGAKVNADNAGAGADQSVHVVAGRSYEGVAVGAGASLAGGSAFVPAASVPALLGNTEAYIGSNTNFATDAHTGDTFGTVVRAAGDVEVGARAKEHLYEAIGEGLREVTPGDILGWFRHAGLCVMQARSAVDRHFVFESPRG